MATTTTRMSFAEFEQLPDRPGKDELLEGELIQMPPAKRRHNTASEYVFLALRQVLSSLRSEHREVELGEAHIEMGYYLTRDPDTWLQPDVSLTHPNQPGDDYEGAPLIAIEVISESNTAEQMDRKIKAYLAHGAREVWVLYPKTRSAWVYRDSAATLVESSIETDILPGFRLELAAVFAA